MLRHLLALVVLPLAACLTACDEKVPECNDMPPCGSGCDPVNLRADYFSDLQRSCGTFTELGLFTNGHPAQTVFGCAPDESYFRREGQARTLVIQPVYACLSDAQVRLEYEGADDRRVQYFFDENPDRFGDASECPDIPPSCQGEVPIDDTDASTPAPDTTASEPDAAPDSN